MRVFSNVASYTLCYEHKVLLFNKGLRRTNICFQLETLMLAESRKHCREAKHVGEIATDRIETYISPIWESLLSTFRIIFTPVTFFLKYAFCLFVHRVIHLAYLSFLKQVSSLESRNKLRMNEMKKFKKIFVFKKKKMQEIVSTSAQ